MADIKSGSPPARNVETWSIIVAALALAVSFLVLFTGNGNQARFEGDRQRCLDNLGSLSESLLIIKYSRVVTPVAFAEYLSDWVASERTCFGGRIISAGTAFHDVWEREKELLNRDRAESWGYDTPLQGEALMPFETRIDRMLAIINNVYATVQEAPGAGALPWQYPELVEPVILP